ncbi:VWA domain-containing protein [Polyangium sp. 15x6]|uniref:VWA domain-containing protein n=1 Tax=Polyangium sp. 15x6 TaxID=3042687 RepID=UPI00249AC673|nr:VWA domain-containing protein [Polyangium sp. 15x6]MDI3288102.1 VWA domain-containing protein [Polyangium sp. 15x6]
MSFATIAALLVALLVAAPVAAHLLRRRQAEEQPFPPAKLVPPTKPLARRRSMLEDRSLFAVRALSVLMLAVLGATPFVRCARLGLERKDGASVALAIVIDDSLSMRAPLEAGTAAPGKRTKFERALASARELATGLRSGDAVAVVLGGAPARVALASTTNMAAVTGALDAIEPSDRATDLDGALALARELLRSVPHADRRVVLLSDLADGAPNAAPLGGGSDTTLWVPLPELEATGRDCAVTRADLRSGKVRARVVCSPEARPVGEGAGVISASAGRAVELKAEGKVLASAPLGPSVRAEEVALDVPDGAPEDLTVGLTPGDAILEDDEAPVVPAGGALPIAVVVDVASTHVATGGPPPIEQALTAMHLDAEVRPLPAVPDHADELAAFAGLIVDDVPGFTPEGRRSLSAWVERGGVLLLTFGPRAATAPLGAGFDPLVPGVVRWGPSPSQGADPGSAVFFGPSAEGLGKLSPDGRASFDPAAATNADMLARWDDGAPLLLRRSLGRGAVFALSLPLTVDESDFVLRPAFLALLDRFVGTARARGGARQIDVGDAFTFDGFKDVSIERLPLRAGEARQSIPVVEQDGRRRAVASLRGRYEVRLDGERAIRVATVPEREIDLRPRRVIDAARAEELGGVAPSIDASPYVALGLLGLVVLELFLRAVGQKREGSASTTA